MLLLLLRILTRLLEVTTKALEERLGTDPPLLVAVLVVKRRLVHPLLQAEEGAQHCLLG
jgi:hypothetical protein